MTDNEIIKALECCIHDDYDYCEECPYLKNKPCHEGLIQDAFNLINRQKAEIERLKDYPKCVYEYDGDITDYCLKTPCPNYKTVDEIKVEAVKEFAERLKKDISFWSFDFTYYSDQLAACRRIDYLAKEMEVKQCTDQKKK